MGCVSWYGTGESLTRLLYSSLRCKFRKEQGQLVQGLLKTPTVRTKIVLPGHSSLPPSSPIGPPHPSTPARYFVVIYRYCRAGETSPRVLHYHKIQRQQLTPHRGQFFFCEKYLPFTVKFVSQSAPKKIQTTTTHPTQGHFSTAIGTDCTATQYGKNYS